MTDLDPERRCFAINSELELHYWPTPDSPAGTACNCGKTSRQDRYEGYEPAKIAHIDGFV